MLLKKQRSKAFAHIRALGCAGRSRIRWTRISGELESSWNGPHLPDQPDDAVVTQTRNLYWLLVTSVLKKKVKFVNGCHK